MLEQAVLDENPDLQDNNKTKGQTYAVIASSLVIIVIVSYFSYTFFAQKEEQHSSEILYASASDNILMDESLQEIDKLSTAIPDPSNAQNALQNTHDQAKEVFNAFGLDPDAFATNIVGGGNSKKTVANSIPSQQNTSNLSKNVVTPFLLNFGVDEQEWTHYLIEKAKQSIASNNFVTANQLISHLTKTEDFIVLSGQLLNNANPSGLETEINLNIETRINASPIDMQAQYFALAALHNKKMSALLFNQAENAWAMISDPQKQLLSALKIAVSYFKAGNIHSANGYFNKIKILFPKINTVTNQIHVRTSISRAFQAVGQSKIALNWLKSTDKFINNATESSVQEIIRTYAYFNRLGKVQALIKQATSTRIKDQQLYHAIKASLEAGLSQNAINLTDLVQESVNKALSYTLLSGYIGNQSSYLISAEMLLNTTMKDVSNKVVTSSRIAQQYARQKNTVELNKLFQQTEQLINTLSLSTEKDKLLEIVITNYAYSLNPKLAMRLSSYIQSPTLKVKMNKKINQLSTLF